MNLPTCLGGRKKAPRLATHLIYTFIYEIWPCFQQWFHYFWSSLNKHIGSELDRKRYAVDNIPLLLHFPVVTKVPPVFDYLEHGMMFWLLHMPCYTLLYRDVFMVPRAFSINFFCPPAPTSPLSRNFSLTNIMWTPARHLFSFPRCGGREKKSCLSAF